MNNNDKVKIVVSGKSYSVPIETRPIWRVSLIVSTIINVSGVKKYLDVQKVNIWIWMLIRYENWDSYKSFLSNNSSEIPLVSVDTANFRAIEFGIAKGFFRLENGRLYITMVGEGLFKLLEENKIMIDERCFLDDFKSKLTASKVKQLTGGGL